LLRPVAQERAVLAMTFKNMNQSQKLFREAIQHIPSGVNSPVRAFRAVGGTPKFIERASGAYVQDADRKRYLDFCMSWGPLILGHANPRVISAIKKQASKGTTYGAPTGLEVRLAELIKSAFPSVEKVRLVSSGTEAVMSAVRLARGVTGRNKIIKCDGGYHGHADSLLVRAGSGAATFGIPNSKGVPAALAQLTLSIPYNDSEALRRALAQYGRDVACFILEPVPANMGVVLPKPDYLKEVRKLTKQHKVLLIFDEVITGFRVAFGGAQELFGVRADLTCLGKILGGGLPIGAFAGPRRFMDQLAPEGGVYQAGTLSGNPLAAAAGIATLSQLKSKTFYRRLQSKSDFFYSRLDSEIQKSGLPVRLNRIGSCFTVFFTTAPVTDYRSATRSDVSRYAAFFHHLLRNGVYWAPSQFEANFISEAHRTSDLKRAGAVVVKGLRMLSKGVS